MCRLFRIQDIGLVRFQSPRPCGDCKAAGSPTKSHGRERYPDPVPTDSTMVVQPPDERHMLVRFPLGGLRRLSCHVTRSVSRADCRSAERGSTLLRGAAPGLEDGEPRPRMAEVRVPAQAPRTRPESGRPSSKRTEWGARPYACNRSRPVDPDRRLLSDATRCNPAAGYGVSWPEHEPPRPRFTAGVVPGLSHPASGSIPAAGTIPWKVRSARCRHRSRKPGGARASGFDSCTFRPCLGPLPAPGRIWKTISQWRERRPLNGWTSTGCGSTPPSSAQ